MIKTCADTTYGCCPDDETAALGQHNAGCPSKIIEYKCLLLTNLINFYLS